MGEKRKELLCYYHKKGGLYGTILIRHLYDLSKKTPPPRKHSNWKHHYHGGIKSSKYQTEENAVIEEEKQEVYRHNALKTWAEI